MIVQSETFYVFCRFELSFSYSPMSSGIVIQPSISRIDRFQIRQHVLIRMTPVNIFENCMNYLSVPHLNEEMYFCVIIKSAFHVFSKIIENYLILKIHYSLSNFLYVRSYSHRILHKYRKNNNIPYS